MNKLTHCGFEHRLDGTQILTHARTRGEIGAVSDMKLTNFPQATVVVLIKIVAMRSSIIPPAHYFDTPLTAV
jgi:hypothetical protein